MDEDTSHALPRRLLLLLLFLVVALHAPSLSRPFFSDDYPIVAQVERKGVATALEHCFTRKYLDAMLDFYRPCAQAAFTLQIAVFGTWELGYHLVSLALLLLCAVLWDRLALRLGLEDRLLRALGILALFTGGVWVESLSWTIAGQQDVLAVAFMLGAAVAFLRASWLSLPLALCAYGSKEFAFVTAPLLACLFAWRPPARFVRSLGQLVVHFAILGAFLWRHGEIIGGVKLPYQQEYGDGLGVRLGRALDHLPSAMQAGLGWSGVALLALGLIAALLASRRRRRLTTAFAGLMPLLMIVGPSLPLLLMPLDSVRFGENTRMLVLLGTVSALVLPLGLQRLPRIPALLLLGAITLGASFESRALHEHWGVWGRSTRNCVEDIAAMPGEHLLVARLPGMLSEAYPAAQLPPFRTPGRAVFPLRLAKTPRDVIPIRPSSDAVGIAVVQPDGHALLMGRQQAPATNEGIVVFEKRPGILHMRGLPRPLGDLGSLHFTATDPVDGLHRIELRTQLPGAPEEQTWHAEFPALPGPQRFCFSDIPVWPDAELVGFRILGGTQGAPLPQLPGALALRSPKPKTRLSIADIATPFELDHLPPGTKALEITLHTPGGATFPIVVPGTSFSFAQLFALGGEYFRFSIDFGVRRGSDVILISVSALADARNLRSVLDRTPPTPYSLELPKR